MRRILLLLGCFLLPASSHGASKIQVTPLFGAYVGSSGRFAMRVEARLDEPFRGRIDVSQKGVGRIFSYPLTTGPGVFRWEFNPEVSREFVEGAEIEVQMVPDKGQPLFDQRLAVEYHGYASGWGNTDPPVVVGVIGRPVFRDSLVLVTSARAQLLEPSRLPVDWRLLDHFGVVVLTGAMVSKLDDVTMKSLTRWMREGGVVVLDSGFSDADQESLLGPHWGVSHLGEPEALEASIEIQSSFEDPQHRMTRTGVWEELSPTNSVHAGTITFRGLQRGDYKAVARHVQTGVHTPMGLGALVLLPIDLPALARQNKDAAGMLITRAINVDSRVREAEVDQYGWWGNGQTGWGSIMKAFSDLTPISVGAVVLFFMVFLCLVGPVEFLILRFLKRKQLTWIVTPVLVAGACYGANLISVMTRGLDPYRGTISVVDYDLDGGGVETLYECLIASRATRTSLSLTLGDRYTGLYGDGAGSTLATALPGGSVELSARAWIPVTYQLQRGHASEPLFQVDVESSRNRIRVRCEPKPGGPVIRRAHLVFDETRVCELREASDGIWMAEGSRWEVVQRGEEFRHELHQIIQEFYYQGQSFERRKKTSETIQRMIDWKSCQRGYSLSVASNLGPLDLPNPVLDESRAMLIVVAEGVGPRSDVVWPADGHETGLYVIRQLVELDGEKNQ